MESELKATLWAGENLDQLVETIKLVLAGTEPGGVRVVPLLVGNPCSLSFVNSDNIVNIAIGAPPMSHLHPVLVL